MHNFFTAFLGASVGCFVMDYVKPRWPVLWQLLGILAVVVFILALLPACTYTPATVPMCKPGRYLVYTSNDEWICAAPVSK
jgi:hypothetical protein